MMKVPFQQLSDGIRELRPEIDAAIARVLTSGWLLLGKELESFEAEWAAYCEANYAVGVSNGLDALHLILQAWGVGPGDEVIVPSNTYVASWLAVTHTGAIPVPVEPCAKTCQIDPLLIRAAITPRTKAIMCVHLYGHPCEMDPIMQLAREFGLKVIEDAAQSHGARYKGKRVGAHGDAVAWSFYPTKNLAALGDAGGITTNDEVLASDLKMLRNYGSRVRNVNEVAGYNRRLEELHAAVLRARLVRLDEWNARRVVQAKRYAEELADLGYTLPTQAAWAESIWHLYTIRHPKRDFIRAELEKAGVGTLIHYPTPPHLQPAYASLGYKAGAFPISEKIHSEILSIPLNPQLTEGEQGYVIEMLREIAGRVG